jgi:predicted alpha/beta-hydrolase family hydrolase
LSALLAASALILSSCGGGGSDGGSGGSPTPAPTPTPTPTRLYADPAQEALTVADVENVVGHAVAEAQARSLPAVIAVTDRVGNVLAVFRMNGARASATTSAAPNGQNIDAQNLTVPAEAGAISKAITGAYLSSGGNAFSTRTASMIVQEHFPPAFGPVSALYVVGFTSDDRAEAVAAGSGG